MQSALTLSSSSPLPPKTLSISSPPKVLLGSNTSSVFPAEACETIGGEACLADIYPEVKLEPEANKPKIIRSETTEREYMDYTDSRTVLLGEACDVLGGEFCEQPYQMGICNK